MRRRSGSKRPKPGLARSDVRTSSFESGRPSGRLKKRSTSRPRCWSSDAQSFRSASRAEAASEISVANVAGDDRLGFSDRHPHRKRSPFGADQLSTLRDDIVQIPHFHENTPLDQEHRLAELLKGRHVTTWVTRIPSASARASGGSLANDEDRSATGAMRGHHQTIEDSQSRDLQATGPGIAHQDGGRLAHCAGLRLPPPKTPRSPK